MTDTAMFHMKRDPARLSFSGISDYLTCRERWKLRYVYGLKAPMHARAAEVGSAVHEGLAHFLALLGPVEEGIQVWKERSLTGFLADDDPAHYDPYEDQVDDIARDAVVLAYRALDEIRKRKLQTVFLDDGRPAVELELSVAMPGWDSFEAHIDWIAYEPKRNLVWIVDFKNRKSFQSEDSEDVNLQNPIYQYMADQHGIQVAGTLTFQIASTAPKMPKQNADGKMSRAAIATDWDTYRTALVQAGLDSTDYQDMKTKLEGREFVNLIEAFRSPATVDRIWTQVVVPVAHEMATTRDLLMAGDKASRLAGYWRTPRNLSQRTCNGCSVREVCLAGLKGFDPLAAARGFTMRDEPMFVRSVIDLKR